MKQETSKCGIKQVLSNTLFMLKHIGKVSPWRIPAILIDAVADWSRGLIFRVLAVGYVLNQIQSFTSLQKIFGPPFFWVSFREHSFEELLFSTIRFKDSVLLHETGFP